MRKLTAALAVLATAAGLAAVSACGAGTGTQTAGYYAPAWGNEPAGECYYVYTPAEVPDLIAQRACAPGSVPVQAPVTWQETYWNYYDSPAYYSVYVPARYRTAYLRTESGFGRTYRTAILTRSRTAVYKSSTGATVHGYSTGTVRFGSGTSFGSSGQTYNSGNLRNRTPAPVSTKVTRPNGTNLRNTNRSV